MLPWIQQGVSQVNLRISKLEGFSGGLLLLLSPLLLYSGLAVVGLLSAITGFAAILIFLRTLSRVYDEPLIQFYANLSALFIVSCFIIARLGGLEEVFNTPYMLGVTLIPALINAITLASILQLITIITFYTLLLLGAYSLLKAFHIASIKSRERMLDVVGYSVLLTAIAGSTLLLPILSGLLMTMTSIYGKLREP
jgi:hypothetical protein